MCQQNVKCSLDDLSVKNIACRDDLSFLKPMYIYIEEKIKQLLPIHFQYDKSKQFFGECVSNELQNDGVLFMLIENKYIAMSKLKQKEKELLDSVTRQ